MSLLACSLIAGAFLMLGVACCCANCENCLDCSASDITALGVHVTLTGVVDGTAGGACTGCSSVNGTYLLPNIFNQSAPSTPECQFKSSNHGFALVCGGVDKTLTFALQLTVVLASGEVIPSCKRGYQVLAIGDGSPFFGGANWIGSSGTTLPLCTALNTVAMAYNSGGGAGGGCDFTASTLTMA